MPVQVANDAELGALAEHVRGLARDVTDLVWVSADYGVGGGIVSGGRPLRGTAGYVGELGHMSVRPGGRDCYCGNRGCWETEVGEPALCRALGLARGRRRAASLVAELRSLATAAVPGTAGRVRRVAGDRAGHGGEHDGARAGGAGRPVHRAAAVGRGPRSRASCTGGAWSAGRSGGTRIETSPLGRDAKLVGAAELAFEPVLAAV